MSDLTPFETQLSPGWKENHAFNGISADIPTRGLNNAFEPFAASPVQPLMPMPTSNIIVGLICADTVSIDNIHTANRNNFFIRLSF